MAWYCGFHAGGSPHLRSPVRGRRPDLKLPLARDLIRIERRRVARTRLPIWKSGFESPPKRAPRTGTISPRALEVLLHRLEIAALPSAVAVAGVTVGHIAVPHRDRGAARRRLQQHFDLRIRIGGGEFGGAPRLDDAPARLELEIPSGDVAVPHRERGAFLRGDLRLLPAGDLFVAAAAQPSVIDILGACRNKVGYR